MKFLKTKILLTLCSISGLHASYYIEDGVVWERASSNTESGNELGQKRQRPCDGPGTFDVSPPVTKSLKSERTLEPTKYTLRGNAYGSGVQQPDVNTNLPKTKEELCQDYQIRLSQVSLYAKAETARLLSKLAMNEDERAKNIMLKFKAQNPNAFKDTGSLFLAVQSCDFSGIDGFKEFESDLVARSKYYRQIWANAHYKMAGLCLCQSRLWGDMAGKRKVFDAAALKHVTQASIFGHPKAKENIEVWYMIDTIAMLHRLENSTDAADVKTYRKLLEPYTIASYMKKTYPAGSIPSAGGRAKTDIELLEEFLFAS